MESSENRAIGLSLAIIAVIWSVNGVYLSALSHFSVAAFWIADLMQWIVIPGSLIYLLYRRYGITPQQYGLEYPWTNIFNVISLGLLAAITFHIFFWVCNYAWGLLGHPSGFFSLGAVFPAGALGKVVWLYSAVTAGVVESIFFIGLPWLLWSRLGLGNPILFSFISSVVFASAHWEQGPHVVAGALAFGLAACAWFLHLRTLWPIVIGHCIIDLIAFS